MSVEAPEMPCLPDVDSTRRETQHPAGRAPQAEQSLGSRSLSSSSLFLWTDPNVGSTRHVTTTGGGRAELRMVDFLRQSSCHLQQLRRGNHRWQHNPTGITPYFFNSFAIAIPAAIFPLTLACMAAYAIAWVPFNGPQWSSSGSLLCRLCHCRWRCCPYSRCSIWVGASVRYPNFP